MASILGFGRYLPERVLTNEELARRLGSSADWIVQSTGILERRIAAPDEPLVDLAVAAARDCIGRTGSEVTTIGLVIVASGSAERRFPGPAALVAARLGIPSVPAIDLPVASAGSLFGLALASRLAAAHGAVLVVAAEKMSRLGLAEPLDRNVAVLFGDGSGACLVVERGGGLEMVDSVLHSDGAFSDDLALGLSGPLKMNGRSVIVQAGRKLPGAINELLLRNEVTADSVRTFLIHQANQNLTDRVAAAVGVPRNRFYSNIARYGNTSSASMLIAASEWMEKTEMHSGDLLCFAAFGAGFHWGALLARHV